VAIAQKDGTAFAEITSKGKLVYLGRLPQYSAQSIWREIKGYQSYMVIGSEAANHGVQIFDMNKVSAHCFPTQDHVLTHLMSACRYRPQEARDVQQ
jgi:hypothetical protein